MNCLTNHSQRRAPYRGGAAADECDVSWWYDSVTSVPVDKVTPGRLRTWLTFLQYLLNEMLTAFS